MDALSSLSFWVFQSEVWLILALLLIVADIAVGLNFFVLPIGIAAALVSAMLFAEQHFWFSNLVLLESWRDVMIAFAVLAVVSVFVVKKLFQRPTDAEDDINTY